MSPQPPPDGAQDARRQLIALENTLAGPAFLDRMRQERRARTPLWLAMRDSPVGRELWTARAIQPFRAHSMAEGAILYSGKGRHRRSLRVAFTGRASRMMLPLAAFLQCVPARDWDVLLLADRTYQHYRFGCGSFATSFPGIVAAVQRMSGEYARVMAMGTSMGGLPAARFGLQTGRPAVAFGARPPSDIARLFGRRAAPPAFDPFCACLPQRARDLIFVHSAGHADDSATARRIAERAGGASLSVDGCDGHAVLGQLWGQDRLGPFLSALLADGSRDARWANAQKALRAPALTPRPASPARILLRRIGLT